MGAGEMEESQGEGAGKGRRAHGVLLPPCRGVWGHHDRVPGGARALLSPAGVSVCPAAGRFLPALTGAVPGGTWWGEPEPGSAADQGVMQQLCAGVRCSRGAWSQRDTLLPLTQTWLGNCPTSPSWKRRPHCQVPRDKDIQGMSDPMGIDWNGFGSLGGAVWGSDCPRSWWGAGDMQHPGKDGCVLWGSAERGTDDRATRWGEVSAGGWA